MSADGRLPRWARWTIPAVAAVALVAVLLAGLATAAVADTGEYGNTAYLSIAAKNPICSCTPVTTASLYPSSVTVSSLAGTVTKATVTLNGITHEDLFDLSVLLVGPAGQNVVLMSAFPARKMTNQSPTFDDAGGVLRPSDCSGTFFQMIGAWHPFSGCNGVTPGQFPSPAPTEPYGSALAVFNGTNPDGTWGLYAMNSASGGSGYIGSGWTLRIETQTPPVSPQPETPASTPTPPAILAAPSTPTPSVPPTTPMVLPTTPAAKKPATVKLLASAIKKCRKTPAKRRAKCIAVARRRYSHKSAKSGAETTRAGAKVVHRGAFLALAARPTCSRRSASCSPDLAGQSQKTWPVDELDGRGSSANVHA